MLKGKVYVVIDGQAGSCGKGKVVGYFARHKDVDVSINNNTPNAGHTFVFNDGRKVITTHLPIAVVNPKIELLIGPGAAINPNTLLKEVYKYADLIGNRKIYVHERAAIVSEHHLQIEKENIKSGSTFKGTAASLCDKIMRKPGVLLAKNYDWNNPKIELFNDNLLIDLLENDKNILVETSQGFDLDINHGLEYPHVTSRGCTVAQALADSGIPVSANIITYMVFRPYPIRISNQTEMGELYSGDYDDSVELTWEDIEAMSGCKNLTEFTTVTKKMRRVFSFSYKRFYHAVTMNNPNYLILNFAQQLDARIISLSDLSKFYKLYKKNSNLIYLYGTNPVLDFKQDIEQEYGVPIAYIGTGPKEKELLDFGIDKYSFSYRDDCCNDENIKCNEKNGTSLTYYRRHF